MATLTDDDVVRHRTPTRVLPSVQRALDRAVSRRTETLSLPRVAPSAPSEDTKVLALPQLPALEENDRAAE